MSAAIGSAIALHVGSESLAAAPTHPNIVIILADDLGWMDLNSYAEYATGAPPEAQYYQTPHLNQLAQEGVSFMRGYSAPLCTPSRARLSFPDATERPLVSTTQPVCGRRTLPLQRGT